MEMNNEFIKKASRRNIIISYFVIICFVTSLISSIPINTSAEDNNEKLCSVCSKEVVKLTSFEDLSKIKENPNGCFVLEKDIDCTGKEFTPISEFSGHFDGNNHKIFNLTITGSSKVGFFSSVRNGTITNFGIENAKVTATGQDIGILIGNANATTISNCYVTGRIEGYAGIGGITGASNNSTTYTNCYSYLTSIKGNGYTKDISGISGWNDSTVKLNNCYTVSNGQKRPIAGYSDGGGGTITEDNFVSCYYDKEYENNTLSELTSLGVTTKEMKTKDTYIDWDFEKVWAIDPSINDGYPYLRSFVEKGNSLTLTPETVAVVKGYSQEFKTELKIDGILSNPSEITWSMEGNKSANTTIDQKGLLQVGADETSEKITVKAKAVYSSISEITDDSTNITVEGYATVLILDTIDAESPKFGASLSGETSYVLNDSNVASLKANASVSDGGTLSYQWYKNKINSTENGEAIEGATEPSYVPDVTIPGTYYYYVEVTNTNESEKITGSKYASSVSDVHTIIVADVHNIIYNLNGGHLSESAPMEFNELMDEFSLENPTRDGYIFEGWYTDENFLSEKTTVIKKGTSSDVILFAKWFKPEVTEEDYEIVTDKNSLGWYKDNVIIKPKNNYIKIAKVLDSTIDSDLTEGIISTDTGSIESDVSTYKWEDSIEIVDESENQQVSFVLLRDDGVITEIKNLDNINIDKSAPNVEININENKFNKFLNKITFGYFFKDTASVKIVSNDELSGVLKTEYQLVSNEDEFNKDGVWIEEDKLNIEAESKQIVYAKVTDKAGNVMIINSEGIVVYTDSSLESHNDIFDKNQYSDNNNDIKISIKFNGNTINKIYNKDYILEKNKDYKVNDNSITIKKEYLQQLEEGITELDFAFNPLGETYKYGDEPLIDNFSINIQNSKAEVTSVTISPESCSIYKGATKSFNGVVEAKNASGLIEWSISGATDNNTTITDKGILFIDENESAKIIKVIATSVDDKTKYAESTIDVLSYTNAEEPQITQNLNKELQVPLNSDNINLKVAAKVDDDGTLFYEWYKALNSKMDDAEIVEGNGDTLLIDTSVPGEYYYYVKITNSNTKVDGNKQASIYSNIIKVTVLDEYSIKYELNGGTNFEDAPISYNKLSDNINLKSPTKNGYIFDGWYSDAEFSSDKITTINSSDSKNIILYAKWLERKITSDDYNINGKEDEKWNKEDIKITPQNGYSKIAQVSEDGNLEWKEFITISSEGENKVSFKLKKDDGTETTAKTINVKIDKTASKASISIKDNKWTNFLNKITFNTFFKETSEVTIDADDNLSGIAKIEYQKVLDESEYDINGTWISFDKLYINPNEKIVIYAKITDKAGNIQIINSEGIVVYTDSILKTTEAEFDKNINSEKYADIVCDISFNGNAISKIKYEDKLLNESTDYKVSEDNITISKEFLQKLSEGDNKLVFEFNPLGLEYNDNFKGDVPNTQTLDIKVIKSNNITFDSNGGDGDVPKTIIAQNGDIINIPTNVNLVKPKYVFSGWVKEDGTPVDNIVKCEGKDIILKANWKKVQSKVTIGSFNKEYSNVKEIVGTVSASGNVNAEIKVSVSKNNIDYTNYTYDSTTNKIIIKADSTNNSDLYKITAEAYYDGDKLDSSITSFTYYYISNINTLYNGKNISELTINNDDLVNSAILKTNSVDFYRSINNLNLSRCITIDGGISVNDEYIVETNDSSIALVSEKNANSVSVGNKSITTKSKDIYINGLKDGNCIITITHKNSGVSKRINVTVNTLNERLYIITPKYTDGYMSYIQSKSKLGLGFISLNNKNINSQIASLEWSFKADNNIDGVKLIKLSNGDVVLYNKLNKFTGTLSSNIKSSNTPISQKIDSNMLSGENVRGGGYLKNTLKITETYKTTLKLSDLTSKNINSNVEVNAFLLKNNQVVEHLSKTYSGNVYKNNPKLKFDFNTDNVGKLSRNDKLEVIYEVTSDKFKPQYIEKTIYSGRKQKNTTSEVKLSYGTNSTYVTFKQVEAGEETDPSDNCISITDDDNQKNVRIYTVTSKKDLQSSYEIKIGKNVYKDTDKKVMTLEGMKYEWVVHEVQLNKNTVQSGTTNNIIVKLKNSKGRQTASISSDFKVASSIGIPEPPEITLLQFFGNISGGEFSNKATGKVGISFKLPTSLDVQTKTANTDNTLSRTFAMLIGTSQSSEENDDLSRKNFKKNLAKEMKKIKEGCTNKDGSVSASISGYAMGTFNYVNGRWITKFSGGGIAGSIRFEYGISRSTMVGFVPVYYGFKVGLGINADVLVAGQNSYHDLFRVKDYNLALDAIIGAEGSLVLEGGIGFDAKVLKVKFGAEGEIRIGYQHRAVGLLNNGSTKQSFSGGEASVYGALRLIFEAKFLWWKYKVKLAEGAYKKTWRNGYSFPNGRPSGTTGEEDEIEEGWSGGFLKPAFIDNVEYASNSEDWTLNLYPYANPIVSKDGTSMGLLYNAGDINDTEKILPAISYNSDGIYEVPEVITGWGEDENVASSIDYDGNSNIQVLAFDAAKYSESDGSNIDDITNSMNSSEIYVTTIIDGNKVTKKLTSDSESDSTPVVYVNGNKAAVLWQKGNYDIDGETGSFGYKNGDSLWYSVFDGNDWSSPKVLEDGAIGTTQSYDVALASDGTIMALTSKSANYNDELNSREIVSYLVKDGNVLREQVTNNNIPETQPKVTVYNNNGTENFVTGYMVAQNGIQSTDSEQTDNDSDIILNIQGYDTFGNIITNLHCVSNSKEISEKYDFVKSDSGDLAVSWIGYEDGGVSKVYSKLINVSNSTSICNETSFSKAYTLNNSTDGIAITSSSNYMINNEDGSKSIKGIVMQQDALDEGKEEDNLEKAAFVKETSIDISNKLENLQCDVTGEELIPNSSINCDLSFKNACSSRIKALVVESDNQVQTVKANIDSGSYGNVNYNYLINDEIKDTELKVTPILENGQEAQSSTVTLNLSSVDVGITKPENINIENEGVHVLKSYIANTGTKSIEGDYVIVKVLENENSTSKITTDSLGAEVLADNTVKISGEDAMKAINEGTYEFVFKHQVLSDSYDSDGIKSMLISVQSYNSNDNSKSSDIDYSDNEQSFGFVKPSLIEGNQFRYDINQDNEGEVTKANITITNNYEVSKASNFKISLLDENSNTIESKVIKLLFNPQETKEYDVSFSKIGNEVTIEETNEEVTEDINKDIDKEPDKGDATKTPDNSNNNNKNDNSNVKTNFDNNNNVISNNNNAVNNTKSNENVQNNTYNAASKETGNGIPFGLFILNAASIAIVAAAVSRVVRRKNKLTKK